MESYHRSDPVALGPVHNATVVALVQAFVACPNDFRTKFCATPSRMNCHSLGVEIDGVEYPPPTTWFAAVGGVSVCSDR